MTAYDHMALAEDFIAAFNAHDLARVGALLSETFLVVSPTGPVGPHGWKRTAAEYIAAFPDTRWVKVQLATDSEGFSLQIIWEGTQMVPPTQRKLHLPVSFRARVKAGKIETLRIDYDPATIKEQLGPRASLRPRLDDRPIGPAEMPTDGGRTTRHRPERFEGDAEEPADSRT